MLAIRVRSALCSKLENGSMNFDYGPNFASDAAGEDAPRTAAGTAAVRWRYGV